MSHSYYNNRRYNMELEFYPQPGVRVPVYIDKKGAGYLLKLVFDVDAEYPNAHKIPRTDLINRRVVIDTKATESLIEPNRLRVIQDEGFRLKEVKITNEKWEGEVSYYYKTEPEELRHEDILERAKDF